jgi:alginate O-acetyltransferase complex protein AlgI
MSRTVSEVLGDPSTIQPVTQDPATTVRTTSLPRDPRAARAAPRVFRFCVLAAQLAGLLLVFHMYHLGVGRLSAAVFGAFLVHYWLPFRLKEPFWITVSVVGAFFVLPPLVAMLLMVAGATFFLILRSPVQFRWRMLALVAIFAALMYGCTTTKLPIPTAFYPVFGAIFMFRIMIYLYDLAHAKEPARLVPFLSYFFLLPNYYFTLFPVIDFQTMRQTYYRRDIHEIAQQGIRWMMRGAIQLMLYRLVLYFNDPYLPDHIKSPGALISTMFLTFMLYLNVSGKFHLIVGMLHLFGYDLPETNRRYMLASSFVDFWRRINIYWKDFMVKVVYFPAYFKLRKRGDVQAQLIATGAVFGVTLVLHSYQFLWLKGTFLFTWPDAIFWTILGLLVAANVLVQSQRKPRRMNSFLQTQVLRGVKILGTFSLVITSWYLWTVPDVHTWFYVITHCTRGGR